MLSRWSILYLGLMLLFSEANLLGESETPVTVRGGEISPIENKPPATETSLAAVSPIIAPHKPVNVEEHAVSVQCYDCNSYKEPECLTNPERFKIQKNCTDKRGGSGYKGCWKIDQWVDYSSSEGNKAHHRVIRQCAYSGDLGKPCYYKAGFGGRINACFCKTELCNFANQTFSRTFIVLATGLIILACLSRRYFCCG